MYIDMVTWLVSSKEQQKNLKLSGFFCGRWLLANKKGKLLNDVINQIAKTNKKSLKVATQERFNAMLFQMDNQEVTQTKASDDTPSKDIGLTAVIRHPVLLKNLVIMIVNWMACTLGIECPSLANDYQVFSR